LRLIWWLPDLDLDLAPQTSSLMADFVFLVRISSLVLAFLNGITAAAAAEAHHSPKSI